MAIRTDVCFRYHTVSMKCCTTSSVSVSSLTTAASGSGSRTPSGAPLPELALRNAPIVGPASLPIASRGPMNSRVTGCSSEGITVMLVPTRGQLDALGWNSGVRASARPSAIWWAPSFLSQAARLWRTFRTSGLDAPIRSASSGEAATLSWNAAKSPGYSAMRATESASSALNAMMSIRTFGAPSIRYVLPPWTSSPTWQASQLIPSIGVGLGVFPALAEGSGLPVWAVSPIGR